MSNILFEQLENAGFVKDSVPNEERVRRASWSEIVDLGVETREVTSATSVERSGSIFSHSASLSLGGGSTPCVALECRSARANELVQFAALYSDRVYIHNFLSDFASHPERFQEDRLLDRTRGRLFKDLQILCQLRPIIESGYIVPVTAPKNWCPHCLRSHLEDTPGFTAETERSLTRVAQKLRARFLTETQITLRMTGRQFSSEVRGPEVLVEHGRHTLEHAGIPEFMSGMPEVMALLARGRKVPLSRKQAERSGLHEAQTANILNNVLFELSISQALGTSFLTERPIHIDILRTLSADSEQDRRNEIIRKHLTALVPFVENASPAELLKLRQVEAHSFLLFRHGLNRVIDEVRSDSGDFSANQARQLYGDILEPSLARLGVKVQNANRVLKSASRRKISAWAGAISLGLFSGFVPSSLAAAAKALGLTKIAADLAESALNSRADDTAIRAEDFYFLWRVRQMSKNRRPPGEIPFA